MHYRLSALLFLVYSIPGSWIPVFSLRLEEELGFEPFQTAWAYAGWAFGAIFASLFAGQIADRYFPIERCVSVCAAAVGVQLLVLSFATQPLTVCLLCVSTCMFMVPIMTLSVTLTLANLENPEQQYGTVRLWGTMGWIVAGLLFGLWLNLPSWLEPVTHWVRSVPVSLADSQRQGGLFALLLAGYALTLPHTPPTHKARHWLAPLGAIHLLRERTFAIVVTCFFLVHVTMPFAMQQTSLFLRHLGMSREWISPTLTIAQWSEVILLGFLARITTYLGTKGTLLLGLSGWATALAILTIGQPTWLVISSLALNAMVITCYIIRGQVFVARRAGREIRASAQGLVTTTAGFGLLFGNILVGWVRTATDQQFSATFGVGLCFALVGVLLLAIGFKEAKPVSTAPASPAPEPAVALGATVPTPSMKTIHQEPQTSFSAEK